MAERLARRVAGHDPLEESYLAASLRADFDAVTARAEQLVGEYTGLVSSGGPARALVLDRQAWVDANIRSFRNTLEPFTRRVGERMAQSPFAPAGRAVAGAEMGVLMGFLAQRVLGQYDLLVPDAVPSGDTPEPPGDGDADGCRNQPVRFARRRLGHDDEGDLAGFEPLHALRARQDAAFGRKNAGYADEIAGGDACGSQGELERCQFFPMLANAFREEHLLRNESDHVTLLVAKGAGNRFRVHRKRENDSRPLFLCECMVTRNC